MGYNYTWGAVWRADILRLKTGPAEYPLGKVERRAPIGVVLRWVRGRRDWCRMGFCSRFAWFSGKCPWGSGFRRGVSPPVECIWRTLNVTRVTVSTQNWVTIRSSSNTGSASQFREGWKLLEGTYVYTFRVLPRILLRRQAQSHARFINNYPPKSME